MKKIIFFLFIHQCFFGQSISLNTDFANNGYYIATNPYYFNKAKILSNEKIIFGCRYLANTNTLTYNVLLLRFNPDGTIDSTFGSNGVSANLLSEDSFLNSITIQSDNKILVCGEYYTNSNATSNAFVARYNENGTIDNTFGTNGIVKLNTANYNFYSAGSIKLDSNQKIIVAGDTGTQTFIARFNTDGSLDASFCDNGIKICNTSSFQFTVESDQLNILADDTMLLNGIEYTDSNNPKSAMVKYNPDGSYCTSFANNGILLIDLSNNSAGESIFNVQFSNQIYYVLTAGDYSNGQRYILKISPDGTVDTSFGTNGLLPIPSPFSVLQNSGKIIYANYITPSDTNSDLTRFQRLNQDGSQDLTFNNNQGDFIINPTSNQDRFLFLLLQSNGNIIAFGDTKTTGLPSQKALVTNLIIDDNLSTNNNTVTENTVAPNPNNGTFYCNSIETISSISVLDILGQEVYHQFNIQHLQAIQTNLKTGIYFLKINFDSGKEAIQKIIIE